MSDRIADLSRRLLALEAEAATASGDRAEELRAEIDTLRNRRDEAVARRVAKSGRSMLVNAGSAVVGARDSGKSRREPTQAQKLIALARKRYDVIKDQHGQAFAVPKQPPRVAVEVARQGPLTYEPAAARLLRAVRRDGQRRQHHRRR